MASEWKVIDNGDGTHRWVAYVEEYDMVVRVDGSTMFNSPFITPEQVADYYYWRSHWWQQFDEDAITVGSCTLKFVGEVAVHITVHAASGGSTLFLYAISAIGAYEMNHIIQECGPRFREIMRRRGLIDVETPHDPLVLDLDGDGIETIGINQGTYFDLNGDGFTELTGWVAPDDGMLVMDRNGNGVIDDGTELFGDRTPLADGTKAKNGFQALAELDGNDDGRIDANDAGFSQLRILRCSGGDTKFPEWRLYTLDEVGIKSIGVESSADSFVDSEGNTRNRVGNFEHTDGTTGQMAEYSLESDPTFTIPTEWLDVPEDIAPLPDLRGYGVVYDLHQAMVRDATGQLKSLVEEFIAEDDVHQRDRLMEQILFNWAGTQRLPREESTPARFSVSSGGGGGGGGGSRPGPTVSVSTGPLLEDQRKLAVLEHFMGEAWPGSSLTYGSSTLLKRHGGQACQLATVGG